MKPTRLMSPPGTYFVTFSTWQRRRYFVVERYVRLFLKTLYGYRRQGKFLLHAFVLMPEHVHLLFTPAQDVTLERAVQLVKGAYSHSFGVEFGKQAFGSGDSPTIAFVMRRTMQRTGITSIRTRW